jgi:formiminotetrahydrofolate cyclodeaminase
LDIIQERLDEALAGTAGDTLDPPLGGGVLAAITVAFSAALVALAARRAQDEWPEAGGALAQAQALRLRATPLAQADAEAYAQALELLGKPTGRDAEMGAALERAAEVPLEIAEVAADVAALAAETAQRLASAQRSDVAAAAVMAEAAARIALHLVEVNLASGADNERVERARDLAAAAARSSARALAAAT